MTSTSHSPHFRRATPPGDTIERDVCAQCGFVHYVNPKIVAGAIVRYAGKILLCRRAIEPRRGYWTLPAGYMEIGETAEQAAMREAREEANADISIDRLFAVYSIPRISQVQIMYLATSQNGHASPGIESLEANFADWQDIPWADLAFPSVHWALEQYRTVEGGVQFPPFANPHGETGGPV